MSRRKTAQGGFTLIELVMTIILFGIISVVVSKILLQGYQSFLTSQNISEADWQGFIALERMADDIHRIRSAADVTTIQAGQLSFNDVNGNNVQFQLSGTLLLRNGQTLASGIQRLTIGYLDKDGVATTIPSLVRYISLSILTAQGNITSSFSTLAATRGMP